MEGFEKGLFPSKSTASPKFSSTGFWENNENDSSQDMMIPKFQNHKNTVVKHFMSPTISAASKVAAPRKKILGERKENSRICDHKTSNLDWKKSPRNSSTSHFDRFSYRIVSSYDHASEPEDDGDTIFLDDSSVKAYDPLKNYLSPRPKYMRFNPNRRHEIFYRLEKEGREELNLNSSFDSEEVNDEEELSAEEIEDSCCSPPKESVVKSKNGEITEKDDDNIIDDYEEEEEEEERGWCLRGVLKLLLTLVACLLSTSYICFMNSPTPSPTQQAIWNLRDGCLMIKNHTLELISTKTHHTGFFEVEGGDSYSKVEEVAIDEDNCGGIEESVVGEIVEDDVENLEGHEKKFVRNENEDNEDNINKAEEFEGERAAEFELKAHNFEQLMIAAKTDETIDAGSYSLEKEVESSYMGLNEDNVNKIEVAESEIIGGGEVESETQKSVQLIGAKADAGGYVLAMEIEGSDQLQELKLSVEPISEETPNKSEGVDDTESLEELIGSHEKLTDSVNEVDEVGYVNEVEMEKSGWNTTAVIGVSVVSILSISLAIIYHSKKARSTPAEQSEPLLKPHKLAVEEKVTRVLPSTERKVEFLARSPLLYHSMEEAPKELNHHIHAPTVELIGEIVVGKVSSSLRSTGKYQMTESEESNATFSASHGSLSQPVSAPTNPSAIEHSTISSPSYGSFTTERNILKKEGGQDREAMIGVTPVRRSSRLRNRAAVTSP